MNVATQLSEIDLNQVSTRRMQQIGARGVTRDGRKFRYVFAAAALDAAKTVIAPDITANHQNVAVQANAAIGDETIFVTLGATAATLNQYRDGVLVVNAGTGLGQQFRIVGNTAANSGGTCQVKVEGQLAVALASADSKVTLYPNKYNGVAHSTTVAKAYLGVTTRAIPLNNYGWIQTGGVVGVLHVGSTTINTAVIPSTTSGAVTGASAAGDQILGIAVQAGAAGEARLVDLRIE